jgi:hypothetical protein
LWIADISWLENFDGKTLSSAFTLFKPENKVLWQGTSENNSSSSNYAGESEQSGVPVSFYLKDSVKEVVMQIFEGDRLLYETKAAGKAGVNQIIWNYQERVREYTAEEKEKMKQQADKARAAAGGARGAGRTGGGGMGGGRFGRGQGADMNYLNTQTGPGEYTVKLTVNGKEQEAGFVVMKDSWK